MEQQELIEKNALHQALNDYANQYRGTEADLDPDLEAATVEQLLQS